MDEERTGFILISQLMKMLYSDWEVGLQGGITESEKCGLVGEIVPIREEGALTEARVAYVNLVKSCIPMIFEFRKMIHYKKLLEMDNVFKSESNPAGPIKLLDLSAYEKDMPLSGPGLFGKLGKQIRKRRSSKASKEESKRSSIINNEQGPGLVDIETKGHGSKRFNVRQQAGSKDLPRKNSKTS